MSAEHLPSNSPPPLDTPTLIARCRTLAERLDAATALAPAPLRAELAHRERDLTMLRDGLIARLRATAPGDDSAPARAALTSINTALSLIFGLEYPGGPLDRTLLTQAAAILRGVAG